MALFRLYKKLWESSFRPPHVFSKNNLASKASTLARSSSTSSPSPSFTRHLKRKHPDAPELDGDDADGTGETSQPSSPTRIHSPSSSRAPTVQHVTPRSKQCSRSQPLADPIARKGISSGITTVPSKAAGKGRIVENSSKGMKKPEKAGEKWWKSLGGGGKGGIKL